MRSKILIVDDEPSLLRLTQYSLEVSGYEVILAETGQEALEKIESEQPNLVILDVMLPDINGTEICRRLRENPKTAGLPIIMLSARVQVTDRIRGIRAGADEYVTKPVDSDELVVRVEGLLRRSSWQRPAEEPDGGSILAFIGAKGGVGTTTIAMQIAESIAKDGKSVIVTELSCSPSALLLRSGLESEASLGPLFDLEPDQFREMELQKRLIGQESGPKFLASVEHPNPTRGIRPEQSEVLVKRLSRMADFLILDLPHHPTPATQVVLPLCDRVTLVVEPDPVCISLARSSLHLLERWGVAEEKLGVVLVNRWGALLPALLVSALPELRSMLGYDILGVIMPSLEMHLSSLSLVGQNGFASHEAQRFTKSVREITAELIGEASQNEPEFNI